MKLAVLSVCILSIVLFCYSEVNILGFPILRFVKILRIFHEFKAADSELEANQDPSESYKQEDNYLKSNEEELKKFIDELLSREIVANQMSSDDEDDDLSEYNIE